MNILQIPLVKRGTIAVGGVLILGLLGIFFGGRGAAFMPWVLELNQHRTDRVVLYRGEGELSTQWNEIDAIVEEVEKFHGLQFQQKPEIVLCISRSQYKRLTGTTARMVSMPIRGRIYVSPRAQREMREGTIRFDTYIRHELSHSLLYQNMSIFHSLQYPTWFMEGLAMISANQVGTDGYYSFEKTIRTLQGGILVSPSHWGTIISSKGQSVKECPLDDKFHFIYSEYALIIHELIQSHGIEKVRRFLKQSLRKRTKPFDTLFASYFHCRPVDVLSKYRPIQGASTPD